MNSTLSLSRDYIFFQSSRNILKEDAAKTRADVSAVDDKPSA